MNVENSQASGFVNSFECVIKIWFFSFNRWRTMSLGLNLWTDIKCLFECFLYKIFIEEKLKNVSKKKITVM